MNAVIDTVNLVSLLVYMGLLVLVLASSRRTRTGKFWLISACLSALLLSGSLLLPSPIPVGDYYLSRGFFTVLLSAVLLSAHGALVIRDVRQRSPRLWGVASLLWLAAIVAVGVLTTPVTIGQPEWLINALTQANPSTLVTLIGLIVLSAGLLGTAFYSFYVAKLPEIANRALFWVLDTALVLMGIVLIISATEALVLIGLLLLLMGVAGAVYAQRSYRVFDIRSEIGAAVATLLQVIVTAALIFGVINLAETIESTFEQRVVVYTALALGAALLYVPLRQLIGLFVRMATRSTPDLADAARRYSQEVSKAVELDQIIEVATRTVNLLMRLRRSGLILVDSVNDTDKIEFLMTWSSTEKAEQPVYLSRTSPVYQRLALEQLPVLQFDIEFSQQFSQLQPVERQWWQSLRMSAYAPIVVEDTLIGVLACGPKLNDAPYYPRDTELMVTMANQTGVALRNARLVADLRRLNHNMVGLNAGLEAAKVQMEKLDSVKTDFVTIASHELRTPLAQIRGYTDIIDALNDQGMLDKDQTLGLVNNLRKATERMEELITAMLDVSQIDVNAMDLRFAQASLESIMRMAIEPLADVIKQRKLTLSARGLRGLPTIQADVQRLVQAFRNIVLNSIKFTPDGGRIEIVAQLKQAERPDANDYILVSIVDSGVGIARENLELIFTKFFRAYDPSLHSTGSYKFMGAGPGLGLTIAKGVIDGHGGRVWAESPGHSMESLPGATFYVMLPLSPPENARRVLPFEGKSNNNTAESVAEPTLMRSQMP